MANAVTAPVTGSDPGSSVSPNGAVANPDNSAVAGNTPVSTGQAVAAPKVAQTLEQAKAARREASSKPATGPALPKADGAPDQSKSGQEPGSEPAKAKTVDPTLNQFTGLRKELVTVQNKLKAAETRMSLADKLEAAQKLADAGKHWDAIQSLHPEWFDKAVSEVVGGDTGSVKPQVDPALAELKAAHDKLEADLKAEKDQAKKAQADHDKAEGRKAVTAYVDQHKDKFPMLARNPEWVDKALNGADEAYPKVLAELGLDPAKGEDLTLEQKRELVESALETGEKYRQERKKLYADPVIPPVTALVGTLPSATIRADMRGGVQGRPVTVGKLTIEQAKQLRRQQTGQA